MSGRNCGCGEGETGKGRTGRSVDGDFGVRGKDEMRGETGLREIGEELWGFGRGEGVSGEVRSWTGVAADGDGDGGVNGAFTKLRITGQGRKMDGRGVEGEGRGGARRARNRCRRGIPIR